MLSNEEIVIDKSIEVCPPGKEKNDQGECIDIVEGVEEPAEVNNDQPDFLKNFKEEQKAEKKNKVKEKVKKTYTSKINENLGKLKPKELAGVFNSKYWKEGFEVNVQESSGATSGRALVAKNKYITISGPNNSKQNFYVNPKVLINDPTYYQEKLEEFIEANSDDEYVKKSAPVVKDLTRRINSMLDGENWRELSSYKDQPVKNTEDLLKLDDVVAELKQSIQDQYGKDRQINSLLIDQIGPYENRGLLGGTFDGKGTQMNVDGVSQYQFDKIIKNVLEKRITNESSKEIQEETDAVRRNFSNMNHTQLSGMYKKQGIQSLTPSQKGISMLNATIQEKQLQLNTLTSGGGQPEGSLKLQLEIESLKNDYKTRTLEEFGNEKEMWMDYSKGYVTFLGSEDEAKGSENIGPQVSAEAFRLGEMKAGKDGFENLQTAFNTYSYRNKILQDKLDTQTYNVKANASNGMGAVFARNGYRQDKDGYFKNVKLRDMVAMSPYVSDTFGRFDNVDNNIKEDDDAMFSQGNMDEYLQLMRASLKNNEISKLALNQVYLMGINPKDIDRTSGISAAGRSFVDSVRLPSDEFLGPSESDVAEEIGNMASDYSVPLDEKQFKNLMEMGLGEEMGGIVGGLPAIGAEFALASIGTGGVFSLLGLKKMVNTYKTGRYFLKGKQIPYAQAQAYAASKGYKGKGGLDLFLKNSRNTKLKNPLTKKGGGFGDQLRAVGLISLEESAKMGIVTGEPVVGLGFGVGSQAFSSVFSKMGLRFTGTASVFNKVTIDPLTGGLGLVVGSNLGENFDAVVDDFTNAKAFNTFLDEHYRDVPWFGPNSLARRTFGEIMTGGVFGLSKLKMSKGDFIFNRAKRIDLADKFAKQIEVEKAKPSKLQNKEQIKWLEEAQNYVNTSVIEMDRGFELETPELNMAKAESFYSRLAKQKKQATGEDFLYEITDSKGMNNPKKAAEVRKVNGKDVTFVNGEKFNQGIGAHELFHVNAKDLGIESPENLTKLREIIDPFLKKALGTDFKKLIDQKYTEVGQGKETLPEEYIANLIEILQNPAVRNKLLDAGVFTGLGQKIKSFYERKLQGTWMKEQKLEFQEPQEVLDFLFRIGEGSAKKGGAKQYGLLKNLKFRGEYIFNENGEMVGGPPKKTASLDIGREINVYKNPALIEQLKLKQSTAGIVAKNEEIESKIRAEGIKDAKGDVKASNALANELLTNNLPLARALAIRGERAGDKINLEEGKKLSQEDLYGEYVLKLAELTRSYSPRKTVEIDGKKVVKEVPFGAYANLLLPLKYTDIKDELKGKIETSSLSTEATRKKAEKIIEDEVNLSSTEKEIGKFNVIQGSFKEGKPSEVSKEAIEKKYDELSAIEKDALNTGKLRDLTPELTAKLFNIDVKTLDIGKEGKDARYSTKINAKKKRLEISETRNIQDVIKANTPKKFVKAILPPFNYIPNEARRQDKGTSMQVPPSLLKFFYRDVLKPDGTKKRSSGVKSQIGEKKRKEITDDLIDEAFGFSSEKLSSDQIRRLRGFANYTGTSITRKVITDKLENTKKQREKDAATQEVFVGDLVEAINNITAGQSKTLASLNLGKILEKLEREGKEPTPDNILNAYIGNPKLTQEQKIEINEVILGRAKKLNFDPAQTKLELDYLENAVLGSGKSAKRIEQELLLSDVNYAQYRNTNKMDSSIEGKGKTKNLTKPYKDLAIEKLKDGIPLGENFKNLPIDMQRQAASSLMEGNTRVEVDGKNVTKIARAEELKSKLKEEGRDSETPTARNKPLEEGLIGTVKNPAPKASTIADLMEVVYGADALIGTGKPYKGNLEAAKYYTQWGEQGVRGQELKILNKVKEDLKEASVTEIQVEFRKRFEEYLAKDGFSIKETQEINNEILQRSYRFQVDNLIKEIDKASSVSAMDTKVLKDFLNTEMRGGPDYYKDNIKGKTKKERRTIIKEFLGKKTIEDTADYLQVLTNQATSIEKGNIPVTSATIKPETSPSPKKTNVLHNEHFLEFFNLNKGVLDLMFEYNKGKINKKQLRDGVAKVVKEAEQGVISENTRFIKDATGPARRDFLNTTSFLYKNNAAENQVNIGPARPEINMAESFLASLSKSERSIVRKSLRNTVNSKLTAEGIEVKQRLENPKDYKKVKINNEKIAKKAGIVDSKDMMQGEILEKLKEKDIENGKNTREGFASLDLGREFNEIISESTGIGAEKVYSDIRARTLGKKKRKWQLFIPDSAADLNGLIDVTLTRGKVGDAQRAWYKKNIQNPFRLAEDALVQDRVTTTAAFKSLKAQLNIVPKDLRKEAIDGFTFEQAIRVHTWTKQGMKVEGLSKRDLKDLNEIIEKNPELIAFSNQLIEIGKGNGYPAPTAEWLAGSISTDLRTGLNKVKRAQYLKETGYTDNIERIYSKENLNKLEAAYGKKYRIALENMLGRMKTGRNRKPSANALENRVLDWINNANGVTMFLNARSAVLQTLSSINFINLSDNNPLKAGRTLADPKNYWKNFMEIMNSDYLVDRRNGLKINVSESEIADAAKGSVNGLKGGINYILSKGYLFTRFADSFAIASGGASFYINRAKTYEKKGLSKQEAKAQAFKDFKEISEESQQSANVSKISMDQSSTLGRLVLAFANTPMQYTRLQKRAILDLANGRGDYKTNLSKVMYYGFVQNLMFNALQNAMFADIWDTDEDKNNPTKQKKKEIRDVRIVNGMLDSTLRGMGIQGAAISTIKNVLLKIKSESNKSKPKYEAAALEVFDFLPPIDSKVKKLQAAGRSTSWNADEMSNMSLMDPKNPAYLAGANVISAATNFPADRIVKKVTNMQGVMTDEMEMWQRVSRFAGWSEWEIGPETKQTGRSSSRSSNRTSNRSSNRK